MLDINYIRKNPEAVKEGIAKKNTDPKLVDRFLRLDEEWRKTTQALDTLKAEQNAVTRELAKERHQDLISRAQVLKKRINQLAEDKKALEEKRDGILEQLPNLPFPDAPVGASEKENVVLREVGERKKFAFPPKDYLELAEQLGIIDVKKAAEVSGSRFGYLVGDAALLEFALVRFAFDVLVKKGFIPVVPPVMVKPEIMKGMGKRKFIEDEDAFFLEKDNLYLVGSAEHSIGPLHMNEKIPAQELPKRYVAFSTCFRREAGSYGKDTRGILRVHQFDKVEMFSFTAPDESEREHTFLLSLQETFMQKLGIPYRVLELSTGDMGFADARQYDVEAWFPASGEYRETHSASNTTDYQARGLGVKIEGGGYAHMLNATGFAIGRTVIAIIENFQTKKGTVKIPECLWEYMGKKEIG